MKSSIHLEKDETFAFFFMDSLTLLQNVVVLSVHEVNYYLNNYGAIGLHSLTYSATLLYITCLFKLELEALPMTRGSKL